MKKIVALLLALIMVLAASAMAEGSLVLYYSHASDWSDPIIQAFAEKYDVQVEMVGLGTGELISRMQAEKANPQGDILWGGVAESYIPIADLLESYKSTEVDALQAGAYDAEEYKWHAFDIEPMVMIYSTALVDEADAPTSWADLLDEKWVGQIASADPLKSSSAFGVTMGIVAAYGYEEGGYEFLEKFVPQLDGKVLSSSSGTFKGVSDKEYAIGLTYEEAAMKYIAAGSEMAIVYPTEGTNIVYSPVAIIKDGPNTENAKLFVDYVLSQEVQSQLAELNRRTSRTDVTVPDTFVPFEEIPNANVDSAWVVEHTEEFYGVWEDLIIQ
ncbi:MAG: extracellular solute-binding protein [Clostridia bacterium]|nr:extracellular solute-binding protein [Clostridia bacterium]